jgi:pyruvate dehydrogenase E1 component alpha subunit
MTKAAERARRGEGPSFISANTFRFRGHSMSDPLKYRSKEEAEKAKLRDPLTLYEQRLRDRGLLSDEQHSRMEEGVAEEIGKAFELAEADPHPSLQSRFDDALAETYPYQPK